MKTYKQLEDEVLEQILAFQSHAGEFHDSACYFPSEDAAICECNLGANKALVRTVLRRVAREAVEVPASAFTEWGDADPRTGEGGPGPLWTNGVLAQYDSSRRKHNEERTEALRRGEEWLGGDAAH